MERKDIKTPASRTEKGSVHTDSQKSSGSQQGSDRRQDYNGKDRTSTTQGGSYSSGGRDVSVEQNKGNAGADRSHHSSKEDVASTKRNQSITDRDQTGKRDLDEDADDEA